MHCPKEFNIALSIGKTYSTANGNFVTWVQNLDNQWVVEEGVETSIFQIQGFKNINLHGVKLQGYVQSPISGTYGIVEDYVFGFNLVGQSPSISGVFSTNNYNASLVSQEFRIGKYQNNIMFSDPIKSLTEIRLNYFGASGWKNSSLLNIRLDLVVKFYFIYTFEGEEDELAFL